MCLISAVHRADGLSWEQGELHPKLSVAAAVFYLLALSPLDAVLLPRDCREEQAEGSQGADQVENASFILARQNRYSFPAFLAVREDNFSPAVC